MEASPEETRAIQMLWEKEGNTGQPSSPEQTRLLAAIRDNVADCEQKSLVWLNNKLAKPPRSGLWSNLYPQGIGWLFLLVVATVVFVFVVVGLPSHFK